MRTMLERTVERVQGSDDVGRPGDVIPSDGTYQCLCCGGTLWRLRRTKRFPECQTHNCPTMWWWARP